MQNCTCIPADVCAALWMDTGCPVVVKPPCESFNTSQVFISTRGCVNLQKPVTRTELFWTHPTLKHPFPQYVFATSTSWHSSGFTVLKHTSNGLASSYATGLQTLLPQGRYKAEHGPSPCRDGGLLACTGLQI